jgi:hypothetical protein
MGKALKRAGKELPLFCPHCSSQKIVRNGHHYGGKLHFLCNTCHKHFTKEVAKGYPTTNIPFPVIAYCLYFRRYVPSFSNMREYRTFVNDLLSQLQLTKGDISRQTIHHWINKFDPLLDDVITFAEAREYVHSRLKKTRPVSPIPYRRVLKLLEKKLGRSRLLQWIRDDEPYFHELAFIISRTTVLAPRKPGGGTP